LGDHSATLHSVKQLCGVKTTSADIPIIKNRSVLVLYPKCMCTVVDNLQVISLCDIGDLLHVAGIAVNMGSENCAGRGANKVLDLLGIHIARLRIDIC